jgi:tRNA1Val (adenine37-N6)-methyltransferase
VKLPHNDLLRVVRDLLSETGQFALILPYLEGLRFQELALDYNLHCTRITEVKPKKDKSIERLLMEFSRVEKIIEKEELIIQNEGANQWTTQFRNLTGEFYL